MCNYFCGLSIVSKSIYHGSPIEKRFGKKGVSLWDITTRLICGFFLVYGGITVATIGFGLQELFSVPLVTIEATMNKLQIVALPGSTLLHVTVLTDSEEHPSLSYWYPSSTLRSGEKYSFSLLPNSEFVLSVTLAK